MLSIKHVVRYINIVSFNLNFSPPNHAQFQFPNLFGFGIPGQHISRHATQHKQSGFGSMFSAPTDPFKILSGNSQRAAIASTSRIVQPGHLLESIPTTTGRVVQPDHLQDDDLDSLKNLLANSDKLKIDSSSFAETSNLRDALLNSIKTNPADVHGVHASLGGSKVPVPSVRLSSESVASGKDPINHNIFTESEYFGVNGTLRKHKKIYDGSATVWHTGESDMTQHMNEVMHLTKVVLKSDLSVGGEDKHIRSLRSFNKYIKQNHPNTLVAATEHELHLIQERNGEYHVLKTIDLRGDILFMEKFKIWNEVSSAYNGIIIASVSDQLVWLQTNSEFTNIEEVWRWQIHKPINFIKYLEFKDTSMLILSGVKPPHTADIYEFKFVERQFWIGQVLTAKEPIKTMAVLDSDPLVVCLGQENEVLLFKYEEGILQHGRLIFDQTLDTPELNSLTSFGSGGVSYLAIAAKEPKIYTYYNGEFELHDIVGLQINNAKHMIPIQVQTYRDDFVLLIEHEILLESHTVMAMRALIWNGFEFTVETTIPCIEDDEDNPGTLSCMIDRTSPESFAGATFTQNHNSLSLLIPQKEGPALVYDVFYEISRASDPVVEELEQLERIYETLAEIEEHQDAVLEDAIETIQNAFKNLNESLISMQWMFDYIGTPELLHKDSVNIEKLVYGGKEWTTNDDQVNLDELNGYLSVAEENLKLIIDGIQTPRTHRNIVNQQRSYQSPRRRYYHPEADSERHYIPFRANGRPRLQTIDEPNSRSRREMATPTIFETLNVDDLIVENINGIPITELVFSDEPQVLLKRVVFKSTLKVNNEIDLINDGKVSGIDLDKKVVHFTNDNLTLPSQLHFERLSAMKGIDATVINSKSEHEVVDETKEKILSVKKLIVKGDLNATNINGQEWQSFLESITFRHRPNKFDSLRIKGVS